MLLDRCGVLREIAFVCRNELDRHASHFIRGLIQDGGSSGAFHSRPLRLAHLLMGSPRLLYQEGIRTCYPLGMSQVSGSELALQERVDQIIRNYRVRGHIVAKLDPLDRPLPAPPPELDPDFYGFTDTDMQRHFATDSMGMLPLREIIERLKATYTRSIGVQFMHIDDVTVRDWLQKNMEGTGNRLHLTRSEQLRILVRLTAASTFEEFVRKRFIGAKSFSLEGAESLIPILDLAIDRAGDHHVDEIVMGMGHRGRLNVLANIIGKSAGAIFREFADVRLDATPGHGDVKYHLGYSSDLNTRSGHRIHLSLCFNPSHLEFVNPVAIGRMRAKQDRAGDRNHKRGMVILIHGDASFAGQGIVPETLNLSQLDAYSVGGTLHVVVNNQVGFTTSPEEGRSTVYCTDIARMLQVPIFHVNGEDPEAVAQVVRLALDFRQTFGRDVVIDMYGYRRLGHNEGDEPSFTQPVMYRAIKARKSVREGYLEHLLKLNGVTREEADVIATRLRDDLQKEFTRSSDGSLSMPSQPRGIWSGYAGGKDRDVEETRTGVERSRLVNLLESLSRHPEWFHPHPKIQAGLDARHNMATGERPIDWAAGEALAFASLATEGYRVRLTGQDSERGTFGHRHAVLHDHEDGRTYYPFQHLAVDQAPVDIRNSPLSETAVLGFDYGYSLDCPDGLVAWEAQYGDFVNVAQPILDQFIASAETKWQRLSGIALLLPHGFEGGGAEHSSGRPERFLALGAEDNIQVVVPTTPAQYFHCLRRQVIRRWRKPVIIMTPKSLLRNPQVVSTLDELAGGYFQRILADASHASATRVLLCCGKIYYDLLREREQRNRHDVAILRIEQLYPLPDRLLREALEPYASGTPVFWVQEEPENMGAWRYLYTRFGDRLFGEWPFSGITRPPSASPATGSPGTHKQEQAALLAQAIPS